MRILVQKRKGEAGQAALVLIMAMGIFLVGAVGLAIDGSHLYAQRQLAQGAADAAAQAGIMSIFDGTNTSGTHAFSTGSTITCSSSDAKTPCYYAQILNRFNTAKDTVTVDFPSAAAVGVSTSSLSATDPVNLLRVTVQRRVDTTFIRLLGPSFENVKASGTAAIVSVFSPVPILVTHPTRSGALSMGGNPAVTICGGPSRSIQVNSGSATAFDSHGSWSVDLSHAGPLDPGNCTSGTGAGFGTFGGPSSQPSGITLGVGKYVQPSSPILDPLADVSPPPVPAAAPAKTALANGVSGCPASPKKGCNLYHPGLYSSGIYVKNETAVFQPGIYYTTSGGFQNDANGDMYMATGFTDGPTGTNTGWTGNMLVYNTGTGTFSVGANSSATLVGSPAGSTYKGILFFQDRTAAAANHSLGGGGDISLSGTIYITNTVAIMKATPSKYQTLSLSGGSGSSTVIQGEIITSALILGGNGGITMNLNPAATLKVRQVALVQ